MPLLRMYHKPTLVAVVIVGVYIPVREQVSYHLVEPS